MNRTDLLRRAKAAADQVLQAKGYISIVDEFRGDRERAAGGLAAAPPAPTGMPPAGSAPTKSGSVLDRQQMRPRNDLQQQHVASRTIEPRSCNSRQEHKAYPSEKEMT